jgi:hypothetical protein
MNFGERERLELAGQRPSCMAVATSRPRLHLGLLCDLQRIVDLDAEIPDGAFELGMPKEKLNGSKIPSASVDQRRLGSP